MLHYNEIQEGQQVKYFGHTCTVENKAVSEKDGTYHLQLVYPNPLMINVTCMVLSYDGNFKDVSPC